MFHRHLSIWVLLILCLPGLGGCMSVGHLYNFDIAWQDDERTLPLVYRGVRNDFELLGDPWAGSGLMAVCIVMIDILLSFALDTVLLPVMLVLELFR